MKAMIEMDKIDIAKLQKKRTKIRLDLADSSETRMRGSQKISLILLVLSIVSSTIAATLGRSDELARDAAIQWLQLVDAGRYEEAASQASQEARAFEQWLNRFKTQRAQLGRVNRRQFVEAKRTSMVSGIPDVRGYHILRFKTSFERKPAATEQITLAKMGCCWEIFEYKVE
jgi:Protein of unknown function (DUF4019)